MKSELDLSYQSHIEFSANSKQKESTFRAFKNRLNGNRSRQLPVVPNLIERYRETVWTTEGENNVKSLLDSIAIKDNEDYPQAKLTNTWLITWEILKTYKPNLSSAQKQLLIRGSFKDLPIFFDSIWICMAGGYSALEGSLDTIRGLSESSLAMLLLDRNMLLFPELYELMTLTFPGLITIDVTNKPIRITKPWMRITNGLKLTVESEYNKEFSLSPYTYVIKRDSLLNPEVETKWDLKEENLVKNRTESVWSLRYSKSDSRDLVNKVVSRYRQGWENKQYIIYHSRNPSYKFPCLHRDGRPITERRRLVELLGDHNIGIIVAGINNYNSDYVDENIIYIQDLGVQRDSFQLHAFNAARLIIGNPSGVTHLAKCTETPLLQIDSPWPVVMTPPLQVDYKILLKTIVKGQAKVSPTLWFEVNPLDYLTMPCHHIHPLTEAGYELECNTDDQLYFAIVEMLNSPVKKLSINKDSLSEKQKDLVTMRNIIQRRYETHYNYLAELKHLSDANWCYC